MKETKKITINHQEVDISEIMELLAQNRKLEAIKALKDQINIGLKDAKDVVEHIASGGDDANITLNNNRLNRPEHQFNVNRNVSSSDSVFIKEEPNKKFYIALLIIAALIAYIIYYKMW